MARFSQECVLKFNELAKQLETTLGPDTGDLAIRAGLHSGPVTAGVLRGEKSRFQVSRIGRLMRTLRSRARRIIHCLLLYLRYEIAVW